MDHHDGLRARRRGGHGPRSRRRPPSPMTANAVSSDPEHRPAPADPGPSSWNRRRRCSTDSRCGCPTTRPESFFATGSGGIGWGVPRRSAVALGDRDAGHRADHSRHDRGRVVPELDPGDLGRRRNRSCRSCSSYCATGSTRSSSRSPKLEETPEVPGLPASWDSTSLPWQRVTDATRPKPTSTDETGRRFQDRADGRRTHGHRGADDPRTAAPRLDDPAGAVPTEPGGGHEPPPGLPIHHTKRTTTCPSTPAPPPTPRSTTDVKAGLAGEISRIHSDNQPRAEHLRERGLQRTARPTTSTPTASPRRPC